ncbi:MAG: hypothetical protein GY913_11115 [Proteobacteria bacterium]|nr:hypothetical protein [Pseudomonadota bacterium]MCP4917464.1 hypothetical protein [Pseudomonadota bacterium]
MTLLTLALFACTKTPGDSGDSGLVDRDEDGFDASLDCNDLDPEVHPDASEVRDGIDNDCDDLVDDADDSLDVSTRASGFEDGAGDGAGAAVVEACELPDDTVGQAGDCDDADASIHPLATEVCDGIDNDCDDLVDDADDSVDVATQTDWCGHGRRRIRRRGYHHADL